MNKRELLDKMQAGRTKLESVLAQLSDEKMMLAGLENGWSVKDLIGHFGWWEKRAMYLFRNLKSGDPIQSIDGDIDQINAQVYAENKARSLAEVRAMEQKAYTEMQAMVEAASEEDLFMADRFAWTKGQPFANWIEGNAFGHYDEHMEALLNWAKSIGVN